MDAPISLPWPDFPEDEVIGELLKSSERFQAFYHSERPKAGEIHWVLDTNLPEGIRCRNTKARFGGPEMLTVIRLRRIPVPPENALWIAHEIEHSVLSCEGFPSVGSQYRKYETLSSSLGSMLHDPIVDSRLQSYGFDLQKDYEAELASEADQLRRYSMPPADHLERLRWIFNYVKNALYWELLITDEERNKFQAWFDERYPDIASRGKKLLSRVKRMGFDTPEKQTRLFQEIIRSYKLRDFLVV